MTTAAWLTYDEARRRLHAGPHSAEELAQRFGMREGTYRKTTAGGTRGPRWEFLASEVETLVDMHGLRNLPKRARRRKPEPQARQLDLRPAARNLGPEIEKVRPDGSIVTKEPAALNLGPGRECYAPLVDEVKVDGPITLEQAADLGLRNLEEKAPALLHAARFGEVTVPTIGALAVVSEDVDALHRRLAELEQRVAELMTTGD